ncbi:MAG: RNA 2',3'-cyclic phosphodiesterase [Bacillota bacterium]
MRLFLAIDIPPQVKAQVSAVRDQLARGVRGVKWVEDHNLHLTVKFLGEVPETQVEEIRRAVRSAVRGYPAFTLQVGYPGFFPNSRSPRVIWLEIRGDTEAALQIGQSIDESLISLGFDPDERRRLHLTLGRFRSNESTGELMKNARSFKAFPEMTGFAVNQVVLYQSQLKSSGPVYSPVEKFVFYD